MQVVGVAISPDAATLATSTSEGLLATWDLATGAGIRSARIVRGPLARIAYARGGGILVAPVEQDVRAFDARDLSTSWTQPEALGLAVPSPDGARVAARGRPGALVLDAADGRVLLRIEHEEPGLSSLAWSPDGKQLAGGFASGRIVLWDAATGASVRVIPESPGKIYALAWSPDGARIAVGGEDGVIRLVKPEGGAPVMELRGHASYVYSLAWTPDGRTLVSGSGDTTVRAWTTRRLAEIARARQARAGSVDHR